MRIESILIVRIKTSACFIIFKKWDKSEPHSVRKRLNFPQSADCGSGRNDPTFKCLQNTSRFFLAFGLLLYWQDKFSTGFRITRMTRCFNFSVFRPLDFSFQIQFVFSHSLDLLCEEQKVRWLSVCRLLFRV